jgi:hypothetical protein
MQFKMFFITAHRLINLNASRGKCLNSNINNPHQWVLGNE